MAKIIITIGIIVLSTTSALGVGILIERKKSRRPISIANHDQKTFIDSKVIVSSTTSRVGDISQNTAKIIEKVVDPTVVASKTGKKYHFPWCSGARRISTSSKIVFKDALTAKKAGYEPAGNCKGLE